MAAEIGGGPGKSDIEKQGDAAEAKAAAPTFTGLRRLHNRSGAGEGRPAAIPRPDDTHPAAEKKDEVAAPDEKVKDTETPAPRVELPPPADTGSPIRLSLRGLRKLPVSAISIPDATHIPAPRQDRLETISEDERREQREESLYRQYLDASSRRAAVFAQEPPDPEAQRASNETFRPLVEEIKDENIQLLHLAGVEERLVSLVQSGQEITADTYEYTLAEAMAEGTGSEHTAFIRKHAGELVRRVQKHNESLKDDSGGTVIQVTEADIAEVVPTDDIVLLGPSFMTQAAESTGPVRLRLHLPAVSTVAPSASTHMTQPREPLRDNRAVLQVGTDVVQSGAAAAVPDEDIVILPEPGEKGREGAVVAAVEQTVHPEIVRFNRLYEEYDQAYRERMTATPDADPATIREELRERFETQCGGIIDMHQYNELLRELQTKHEPFNDRQLAGIDQLKRYIDQNRDQYPHWAASMTEHLAPVLEYKNQSEKMLEEREPGSPEQYRRTLDNIKRFNELLARHDFQQLLPHPRDSATDLAAGPATATFLNRDGGNSGIRTMTRLTADGLDHVVYRLTIDGVPCVLKVFKPEHFINGTIGNTMDTLQRRHKYLMDKLVDPTDSKTSNTVLPTYRYYPGSSHMLVTLQPEQYGTEKIQYGSRVFTDTEAYQRQATEQVEEWKQKLGNLGANVGHSKEYRDAFYIYTRYEPEKRHMADVDLGVNKNVAWFKDDNGDLQGIIFDY